MRSLKWILVASLLSVAQPAGAHTGPDEERWTATATPCATACARWLTPHFDPCAAPFPPGSFSDHLTRSAPALEAGKTAVILEVAMDSQIDWDVFLCSAAAPFEERDAGTTGLYGVRCDGLTNNFIWPVQIGCHEDVSTPVAAGEQVIVRAYNSADPEMPAHLRAWFRHV